MPMIKMTDIANKAGVSRSAVSHVLSGNKNIRIPESTRQRILQAAAELGYRPNELARAVASGKTRMIGYLVSEPDYEPHWNTIVGAISEVEEYDHTLEVLSITGENFEDRIRQCIEQRLSGLIVRLILDKTPLFREAERARIPVVVIDEGIEQPFGTRIASDDATGIRAALAHLTELGHQHIGFISSGFSQFYTGTGDSGDIGTARERLFLQEMGALGISVPEGYVVHEIMSVFNPTSDFSANNQQVISATQRLLSHPSGRPTAILCWRDETAMVAVRACRQAGLHVPDDISVVGFSDIYHARFFDPPLSTVRMPWDEMGRRAVRQLCESSFEQMASNSSSQLVESVFVARESSGPAPIF